MARGWESKGVESQMEASQSSREESAKKRLTPELAEAQRRKHTLALARNHLQHQLQVSEHPRHRQMIENALTDVDRQLSELGGLD